MAVVIIGIFYVSVSIWPSMIDRPIWFILCRLLTKAPIWLILVVLWPIAVWICPPYWCLFLAFWIFLMESWANLSVWEVILMTVFRLIDSCSRKWLSRSVSFTFFLVIWWRLLRILRNMMESRTNLSVWEVVLMTILWLVDSCSGKWLSRSVSFTLIIRIRFRFRLSFSMLCLGSHGVVVKSVWVIAFMAVFRLIDSCPGKRSGRIAWIQFHLSPGDVFLSWLFLLIGWLFFFLRHELLSIRVVSWHISYALVNPSWCKRSSQPFWVHSVSSLRFRANLGHQLLSIWEIAWLLSVDFINPLINSWHSEWPHEWAPVIVWIIIIGLSRWALS